MSQFPDPTLLSINSTWPGLIADLSLEYGELSMRASTASRPPLVAPDEDWVQISGGSSVGSFNLYLKADVCVAILEASDQNLDITQLDGTAAAIIFEHVTSYRIEQLETVLGCDLAFTRISDVTTPISETLLGLKIEYDDQTHNAGISVTGKLAEWVEYVVANNSNLEERSLSDKMIVQLGPVILTNRQAYLVRKGEVIDCGVMPSEVIHGILLRDDNRYWPIYIEDSSIEIAGPLSGPAVFDENNDDRVFVTFGIGDVTLQAIDRVNLGVGSKLEINRYGNNGANIYYQTKPFGRGFLSLHGENLAVSLDTVGAFEE